MKIELGPVRIARIVGKRVRRFPNGSLDMDVVWEDATEGKDAGGVLHLHEREVGMILNAVRAQCTVSENVRYTEGAEGKRRINGRGLL